MDKKKKKKRKQGHPVTEISIQMMRLGCRAFAPAVLK